MRKPALLWGTMVECGFSGSSDKKHYVLWSGGRMSGYKLHFESCFHHKDFVTPSNWFERGTEKQRPAIALPLCNEYIFLFSYTHFNMFNLFLLIRCTFFSQCFHPAHSKLTSFRKLPIDTWKQRNHTHKKERRHSNSRLAE